MIEGHSTLNDIILLLAAAVFIVALFRKLRLNSVLGYFAAGALVGPHGLGHIKDVSAAGLIAEFGVVFLLFVIGLELSLERLKAMRLHVFGLGGAQVALTVAAIAGAAYGLGVAGETALIIGGGLALSSTAIVLKLLQQQKKEATQIGRLSLAVLLLQDFVVVPMLVLVPILARGGGNAVQAVTEAMFKGIGVMVVIIVVGRLIIRPIYQWVSSTRNAELFAALNLLLVLGTAWITEHMGLSMALGAFIAGLLVAETEYHHQVMADILPFKGLLLGLFFMTVGMYLDPADMWDNWLPILSLTAALMAGKAAILIALCRLFRFPAGVAIRTGLLLAQGGEFAFVLFKLAEQNGVLDTSISHILLPVVVLSMALTPALDAVGRRLGRRFAPLPAVEAAEPAEDTADLEHHVVLAGFGRVGQTVAKLLVEEQIPFVAIDTDANVVSEHRRRGMPVYFGDMTRMEALASMGIERAHTILLTSSNISASIAAIPQLRRSFPDLTIIARAGDEKKARELIDLGAHQVVPETLEASLQIGGALLKDMGTSDAEIERVIAHFRAKNYALVEQPLAEWEQQNAH